MTAVNSKTNLGWLFASWQVLIAAFLNGAKQAFPIEANLLTKLWQQLEVESVIGGGLLTRGAESLPTVRVYIHLPL
jgi:hypothetical protein